jgi:ABC-type enterochelin transport system permease subunit
VLLVVFLGWLALKLLPATLRFLIWLLPIVLVVAGLFSCLQSGKAASVKLLWVIIIILAPVLGSLLWFVWGKENT